MRPETSLRTLANRESISATHVPSVLLRAADKADLAMVGGAAAAAVDDTMLMVVDFLSCVTGLGHVFSFISYSKPFLRSVLLISLPLIIDAAGDMFSGTCRAESRVQYEYSQTVQYCTVQIFPLLSSLPVSALSRTLMALCLFSQNGLYGLLVCVTIYSVLYSQKLSTVSKLFTCSIYEESLMYGPVVSLIPTQPA